MWYPELLIPSIVSLVCVLAVAPWHIRIRNLATLSMIFWMGMLNTAHIVNSSVWTSDVINRAPVWCDISTAIQVGYNTGLPMAHLILSRQLESLTSLRTASVIYDDHLKRRNRIIDLGLAFGIPAAGILLHLAAQDRRFYILQGTGCFPATYWDAYGVILMAVVPVIIAVLAVVYTAMTFWNIYSRQRRLKTILSDTASISRDNFIRLYCLGCAEIATCLLRAYFNLTAYMNAPQLLNNLGQPHHSLTEISTLTKDEITKRAWHIQLLQWYTVTACSFVFFLCFATGSENLRFYRAIAHAAFPRWVATSRNTQDWARTGISSTSNSMAKLSPASFASSTEQFASQLESGIVDPDEVDAYNLEYLRDAGVVEDGKSAVVEDADSDKKSQSGANHGDDK